jgi:hypothetical protein
MYIVHAPEILMFRRRGRRFHRTSHFTGGDVSVIMTVTLKADRRKEQVNTRP